MFDEMGKQIDAVTVSIPDHFTARDCHGAASGEACYTQKPLAHASTSARELGETGRRDEGRDADGQPGHRGQQLPRRHREIRAGVDGHSEGGPRLDQPADLAQGIESLAGETRSPKHFELGPWIGPAKMRPYGDNYHPFAWRGLWDFGTGALGDMACHTVNMPFMALDLRNPISVVARLAPATIATAIRSRPRSIFEFPATDKRPPVTLTWYDGGNLRPQGAGTEEMLRRRVPTSADRSSSATRASSTRPATTAAAGISLTATR